MPSLPWLNFERIGWLFSSQTGKIPEDYTEYINNGEYLEKGARQIPQFCNLNRHRRVVCQYMKSNHPRYVDEYARISQEEIQALSGKTEFLMNGLSFKRVNPYDPKTYGQLVEHEGVYGGIVLGKDCWFSYSAKAPHACINIDNIKAVNKVSFPVSEVTAKFLREHQSNGTYGLVMRVRLRSPFSLNSRYVRSLYKLGADANVYTAWVVVTNIYLADDQGRIFADIPVSDSPSDKDRIDAELRDHMGKPARNILSRSSAARVGSKVAIFAQSPER